MANHRVAQVPPARHQNHDVAIFDLLNGLNHSPFSISPAHASGRTIVQSPDAHRDHHRLALGRIGLARPKWIEIGSQFSRRVALPAVSNWAYPLESSRVLLLRRLRNQLLRLGVVVGVGEEAVSLIKDVFPPLVHDPQQATLSAIIYAQRNQSLSSRRHLIGVQNHGAVVRIEGNPISDISSPSVGQFGASEDLEEV